MDNFRAVAAQAKIATLNRPRRFDNIACDVAKFLFDFYLRRLESYMPEEAVQAAEEGGEKQVAAEENAAEAPAAEAPANPEDVHYQAVEKEGTVTAIWEMQGQKHIRTIDPRSNEGKQILALFETAG